MEQEFDPREALATASGARQRLAARAASPWWYAPLYGLGVGGMVASFALRGPLIGVGIVASTALVVTIYTVWKAKTGLSVSGYRRGRTLPLTLAFVAVLLGLMLIAVRFGQERGQPEVALACGVIAGLIAAWASHAWDRIWRAEMTEKL